MIRHVQPHVLPAPSPGGDTLVVVLHGCTRLPSSWLPPWRDSWWRRSQIWDVLSAIHEVLPTADIAAPTMPIEYWSFQDPNRVVDEVLDAIDEAWQARAECPVGYSRVILVGFSFGSVLLRQVYCRAAGATTDAMLDEHNARPWVTRVERMVLLAGVNRGWTTDSPVSRIRSIGYGAGVALGYLVPGEPCLFAIRRGAPFLTGTRLQWHALDEIGRTPPVTVQLLGTRDDIVSPADNIDLATGGRFLYLEVPSSGHFDLVAMSTRSEEGQARRQVFQAALTRSPDVLQENQRAVTGADLLGHLPLDADPTGVALFRVERGRTVDDIVFIIHGIRDKGYWTAKVARAITSHGSSLRRDVLAIAPTYGYFPLLPFLLPWTRRAKIEWLLDMYVNARCSHPKARVSYVGHSNGTFLLAGAVERCPSVRFHDVVFAGTVVSG